MKTFSGPPPCGMVGDVNFGPSKNATPLEPNTSLRSSSLHISLEFFLFLFGLLYSPRIWTCHVYFKDNLDIYIYVSFLWLI